jgi:hypothetical protein
MMLRRLVTLTVAIVVAALPALNRICLTSCDAEMFPTAADSRAIRNQAHAEGGNDRHCPLHDRQPSSETQGKPDVPPRPAPCQHQQEAASTDHAKLRSLVPGTDDSLSILTVASIAGSIQPAIEEPNADRQPVLLRRPSNALVLRI